MRVTENAFGQVWVQEVPVSMSREDVQTETGVELVWLSRHSMVERPTATMGISLVGAVMAVRDILKPLLGLRVACTPDAPKFMPEGDLPEGEVEYVLVKGDNLQGCLEALRSSGVNSHLDLKNKCVWVFPPCQVSEG